MLEVIKKLKFFHEQNKILSKLYEIKWKNIEFLKSSLPTYSLEAKNGFLTFQIRL